MMERSTSGCHSSVQEYVTNILPNEINRGKEGFGNYTLKSCYENLAITIEQLRQVNTVTPAKIIESLRSKTFMIEQPFTKTS